MKALRPAAFLDRDGTIMEDRHYIGRAEDVVLLDGAAGAIRRLNEARIPVIVVTNQSGIARGFFDAAAYGRVRDRLAELLEAQGARIDATYLCPHHPDVTGPCACRKPGDLLFRQAAGDHGLDLHRSALLGDKWRDVEPAAALGARGILIPGPETPEAELAHAAAAGETAPTLRDAVDRLLDSYWRD